MSVNVKLRKKLVDLARQQGAVEGRSVPKQIEYWSQIGESPRRTQIYLSV